MFFFFFQAEDGIRDKLVTGVQTCALPISGCVRFTLDIKSGRTQHLLLATVTGIAPFVSYVRTMYKDWKSGGNPMPGNHKLYCLQGGSRSWEFGYREEMERIAAEVPWFKFVTTISRPWEDAAWKGETGRVDDLVRKYTDLSGCGQKPLADTFAAITACARTGKASSSAPAGRRFDARRCLFYTGEGRAAE